LSDEEWACEEVQFVNRDGMNLFCLKQSSNDIVDSGTGHKNIEGNEREYLTAKIAAIPSNISPNIIMKSAQNRSIQSMTDQCQMESRMENGQRKCKTIAKHEQIPGHNHRTELV
jgi:hypothetical protein